MKPKLIVNHSKKVLKIAKEYGWRIGARYTNLRDVRTFKKVDFIDIDWKNYNYDRHLAAVKEKKPFMTVARDVELLEDLEKIINQARELNLFCRKVIIVPKDIRLKDIMEEVIDKNFILGYSVPTKYGGTKIPTKYFKRKVHLLGGRPDKQRKLGDEMNVFSLDCNRFTLDAQFGKYFNGERFVKIKEGGYEKCLRNSIENIGKLWKNY